MTLEQLRIFVAVAERLHMTRAAEALLLTQSAVSSAISSLEARYGTQLFDRVGRGLELNSVGQAFLPEARAVLERAAAARGVLDDLAGLDRGSVRIHASLTIAAYWLPQYMAAFKAEKPMIELRLDTGNTAKVIDAVNSGEAEIGLIEGLPDHSLLECQQVGSDRLIIVASPNHPLAQSRLSLQPVDLPNLSWVMREDGSGTRSVFESYIPEDIVRRLQVALTFPTNEAILTAVSSGQMVTAISELAARPLIEAGRLVQLPYKMTVRPFYLLRHKSRSPSRAAKAFALTLGAEA